MFFSPQEYASVYGHRGNALVAGEEPVLARSTVCAKSFGRAESQASALSLLSRLRSIHLDSLFLTELRARARAAAGVNLPFYANLRQGAWYFAQTSDGECRFRSTDGHARGWTFHASRSNIPFLLSVIKHGGAFIVDSTRTGKTFPDAFNRTLPLWCAIVNRALGFPQARIELPPWFSEFEASKISEEELNVWAQEIRALLQSSGATLKELALPLRPFWIANRFGRPAQDLPSEALLNDEKSCLPIICVACSWANITGEEHRERFSWPYIAGAGDDEENWSLGLTPAAFWNAHEYLLDSSSTHECEMRVREIVLAQKTVARLDDVLIIVPQLLQVQKSTTATALLEKDNSVLDLTHMHCMDKLWCRRNAQIWPETLRRALQAFKTYQTNRSADKPFTIIAGDLETALAMCIALLVVFFNEDFLPLEANATTTTTTTVDKQAVRRCEAKLISKLGETSVLPRRLVKEIIQHLPNAM